MRILWTEESYHWFIDSRGRSWITRQNNELANAIYGGYRRMRSNGKIKNQLVRKTEQDRTICLGTDEHNYQ